MSTNAERDAHVQELIYQMHTLRSAVTAEDQLWYGGLPPLLHQLLNFLDGHAAQMTSVFNVTNEARPPVE